MGRIQKERRSAIRVIETDEELVEYRVIVLDARTGSRLMKLLGCAIGELLEEEGATLGQQLRAILESSIEIETIADIVLRETYVDHESLADTWPYHFANDWAALIATVLFAVETNFGNFSDALPRLLARYLPTSRDTRSDEPG